MRAHLSSLLYSLLQLIINILFGSEARMDIDLSDNFWNPTELVSELHNSKLCKEFSEKEIRDAVFGSYAEGAPGPDGFPFLFYQQFWEFVKPEILAMFKDWHLGKLDLFRLNFSLLTLIPKEPDARTIQKFRPITLTNCSFKIFSKCVTNRLGMVSEELITPNQTAFIRGRFILESMVSAHEIIHDAVQKKKKVALSLSWIMKKLANTKLTWNMQLMVLVRGEQPARWEPKRKV
jgi:hypothetical protein